MSNTCIMGKVIDEKGVGLGGLIVEAYDLDLLTIEQLLGTTETPATGEFSITYDPMAYGWLEARPDLVVRIFDLVGRLLFESRKYHNVTEVTLDIGEVVIEADGLRGWRVTQSLGYPALTPQARPELYPLLSCGNLVIPLIDNEDAWRAFTQAVQNSTEFVQFMQLVFKAGMFSLFDPPVPQIGSPTTGIRMDELLLAKSRDQKVKVRILLNDFILVPAPFDSADTVTKYFEDAHASAPHTVEVRSFRRPFRVPLHSKIAIVDGRSAYILGSPLVQGCYDAPSHHIDEPRRGVKSFLEHTAAIPTHDVSAAIEGPAVEALNRTFVELWNEVGEAVAPISRQAPLVENAAVQIVRTVPGNLLPTVPKGETGILEAYQRAFREAEDYIFLDNQYFTEPLIAKALANALTNNRHLQLMMVINSRIDVPFYNILQANLIRQMLAGLTPQGQKRVGIYTLWKHDSSTQPQRIVRIYTHAKVGVVDDKWATIGSANLDGLALRLSQLIIPPITARHRLQERSIEVNAVIYNGVDGLPPSHVPADLRRSLWAEHLGYADSNHPDLLTRPPSGWLELWQDRAAAKLAGLRKSPPAGHAAHILEWRPEPAPAKHLRALGLTRTNLKHLAVESAGRSFSFEKGDWE
jgi:phosphatidylserine/phosphatidylglycerophosphate/cardiolipin synthase-like enzyme